MTMIQLTRFFLWCTILNGGLLVLSSLLLLAAPNFVYRLHSRWFPMSRETFNAVIYAFLGVYKVIVIAFNLVPWLALMIIG